MGTALSLAPRKVVAPREAPARHTLSVALGAGGGMGPANGSEQSKSLANGSERRGGSGTDPGPRPLSLPPSWGPRGILLLPASSVTSTPSLADAEAGAHHAPDASVGPHWCGIWVDGCGRSAWGTQRGWKKILTRRPDTSSWLVSIH